MGVNFKNMKPSTRNIQGVFSESVNDIIEHINPGQLDIGVVPKIDTTGNVSGFEVSLQKIKEETRTYRIGEDTITLKGTIYGVAKNETTGKYAYTFFQPNMVKVGEEQRSLLNLFETARDLLKMVKDMQYWTIPARTLTDVANSGMENPAYKGFVGQNYALRLLTEDAMKYTRANFLQYIDGEIGIFQDLINLTNGKIASQAGVVPATTAADAFVEGSEIVETFTEISKRESFGPKLTAHGPVRREEFKSPFGTGSAINKAGGDSIEKPSFKGGLKKR